MSDKVFPSSNPPPRLLHRPPTAAMLEFQPTVAPQNPTSITRLLVRHIVHNPITTVTVHGGTVVAAAVSGPSSDVSIGNGSLPPLVSNSKNETTFRGVVVATSSDLDEETANNLRPDLKKKNGISLKVEMDTKATVKLGGLKSKKVGIRVSCDGVKGVVPKGKSPSVANVAGAKCKLDLRIKIWIWTF
ncbi:hypothetical protein F3Y22_tig00110201pilonHSYRG00064 [Hibiscus syriacus]|uniref:Uncharacterized protein n=1 Tax=Hibiscus syriacus TaxID=106335 RepID=A0A6A3BAS2_HIBSY|nr:uncharacterized protein LOC120218893 [Hibiscus syriacus]KAE8714026.1 hypothetical protein F3Y22_tig00110201pilonHSYRG00064 [Hibiscus syriacus]